MRLQRLSGQEGPLEGEVALRVGSPGYLGGVQTVEQRYTGGGRGGGGVGQVGLALPLLLASGFAPCPPHCPPGRLHLTFQKGVSTGTRLGRVSTVVPGLSVPPRHLVLSVCTCPSPSRWRGI